MKTKVFKVKMSRDKRIYRTIEVSDDMKLYDFAKAITDAFAFDFDHCFGFYDNIKNNYKSEEFYELFADMDDNGDCDPKSKSVKDNDVKLVFPVEKEMLFLFDYGDNWGFIVKCIGEGDAEMSVFDSVILKSSGTPPEQYPDYDEEGEEN